MDPAPDKRERPDDDEGPLLMEGIRGSKAILIGLAVLVVLGLLALTLSDPLGF